MAPELRNTLEHFQLGAIREFSALQGQRPSLHESNLPVI